MQLIKISIYFARVRCICYCGAILIDLFLIGIDNMSIALVNHVIEFNFDSLSELHSNSVTAAVKFHVHESLPEVGR